MQNDSLIKNKLRFYFDHIFLHKSDVYSLCFRQVFGAVMTFINQSNDVVSCFQFLQSQSQQYRFWFKQIKKMEAIKSTE